MTNKLASLFLLFGLDVTIALGAESVSLTRDEILDHIRGGWTGMLIGGIEGLAHEFKYIQQPRQDLPDYTFLPQGARTDDDNDFEFRMDSPVLHGKGGCLEDSIFSSGGDLESQHEHRHLVRQ
jgi:hypothetical protein